ncbi:hypothetical protein GCM10010404_23590 [Nonomuraea africana]
MWTIMLNATDIFRGPDASPINAQSTNLPCQVGEPLQAKDRRIGRDASPPVTDTR